MVKNASEREWYVRATIQNGWSRNVLVHQIESGLLSPQGKALTNFTRTLPAAQSELAQQVVKDPYNFEFLMLAELRPTSGILERALIACTFVTFLLELGVGFCVCRQPVSAGGGGPGISH